MKYDSTEFEEQIKTAVLFAMGELYFEFSDRAPAEAWTEPYAPVSVLLIKT